MKFEVAEIENQSEELDLRGTFGFLDLLVN